MSNFKNLIRKRLKRGSKRQIQRDARTRTQRLMSFTWARIVGLYKFFARSALSIFLILLAFLVTTLAFIIFTPKIEIHSNILVRGLRFLPDKVAIQWRDAGIEIESVPGEIFEKHVLVHAEDFCVIYAAPALDTCLSHVHLGLTAGWKKVAERRWELKPDLQAIDPIELLGGRVNVDVTAFPPSDPDAPASNFSMTDLLRNELLPKWNLSGSRVELSQLNLKLKDDAYRARFLITTGENGEALRMQLDQFTSRSGLVSAGGLLRLVRGGAWAAAPHLAGATPTRRESESGGSRELKPEALRGIDTEGPKLWKLWADAHATIQRKMLFDFKADANIKNWNSLDFRISSKTQGVAALREARIEASYEQSKLSGVVSLKLGETSSQVKAIDFVNCRVNADLDRKEGGVRCGPQGVRLQIKEVAALAHPEFFTLAPQLDLRISKLEFGAVKSGDVSLMLTLNHFGLLTLQSKFQGRFELKSGEPFTYHLGGQAQLINQDFARVVRILHPTPFSVPAPFNDLSGKIALNANVGLDQSGGAVHYELKPDLDSQHQAVHLRLVGETDYLIHSGPAPGPTEVATDISAFIDTLHLSAPRMDLALPPQIMPDGRFHKISATAPTPKKPLLTLEMTPPLQQGAAGVKDLSKPPSAAANPTVPGVKTMAGASPPAKPSPMRFRLHVKSSDPRAIQVATSLTKTIIPIDADVTYAVGPWSGLANPVPGMSADEGRKILTPTSPLVAANEPAGHKRAAGQTTGYLWIGQTKLDLFRRNAVLDHLRIDLLPDGGERLEGRANVHYLQYDIAILVNGQPAHPDISFMSKPELDNQQEIISVLIFGRPMDELAAGDKTSVANLQAAFADAALGLGSLYLLANTPIQSVGYNPQTQALTATVGLGAGSSVEVGTTDSVAFNKTLGREFTFRTEVDKLASSGESSVTAMIQWIKGF